MASLSTHPFPPPVRNYLPAGFDAADLDALQRLLSELAERPLPSVAALERWLADLDEVFSALDALESRAAIATTAHTDDLAARERHLDLQTRVLPASRRLLDGLDRRYLECPHRAGLDRERWGVHDRSVANRAALFHAENLPVDAAISRLVQDWSERAGSLTVRFRGEAFTPQGMTRFLEDPDRDLREQAWLALARCRLDASEELQGLFDRLLEQRLALATNAGFTSFRDYCWRERERFDYDVEHCEAFHAAVEEHVVPALSVLHERRRRALGVSSLRPWDLAVDPRGRPPLRVFQGGEQLAALGQQLIERVDRDLGAQFRFLREQHLLDLDNRPHKAPGAYQSFLEDTRLPYIFANAVGVLPDLRTLLHESGHAFHSLAAREQPLRNYRHAPLEFAEVASMSMELLAAEQFPEVLGAADGGRARRAQLERTLELLPWVATVDAFQHWLYSYPEHTRAERREHWLGLRRRLQPDVDWSGHEGWLGLEWQHQLHLFKYPFYYIEYGIAQIGALQVWLNLRNRGRPALTAWREALALGGSRPLPELFTAAHICFDFGPAMVQTLVAAVLAALEETPEA